ncbi:MULTISPECIES: FtsK/SpoIIIE domain-containing protein [Mycolicibacter]|uniref:FtsK/SpoIIIE domain-containing protein n=2 Tax=Mycolicibacter TaxID=1073531 RepID=A0ABU5XMS4_9MYCO|nr:MULTISPECIES: FtsK/SpoIIIE domain-containing protein [unclassified Mycolicibacter]MEB3023067.1 FtsK/SpoIIIE domain-containing protein [Mycolicibacter sp. MYC098]MEB3033577.1 FtsK/SpoIIIE domain-containing protein [Mycolicibacter sp. MYC340]
MVSNRTSQQARQLMRQNPALRYQQALDQIRLRPADTDTQLGLCEALGITDVDSFDPRPGWESNERDSHFHFPLGYTHAEGARVPLTLDIGERSIGGSGPHGCIQGITGSGKSLLLAGMVLGAAILYSPAKVNFMLMDFHGDYTFGGFEKLPHVVANLTDLNSSREGARSAIGIVDAEIQRRLDIIDEHNVPSVSKYRQRRAENPASYPPCPELFLVIDDFHDYMARNRDDLRLLSQITMVGRAVGIHLIASAQRIDRPLIGAVAAHFEFGISFRTSTASQSREVLKSNAAAELPLGRGSALLRQAHRSDLIAFNGADIHAPVPGRARSSDRRQREALTDRIAQFPGLSSIGDE